MREDRGVGLQPALRYVPLIDAPNEFDDFHQRSLGCAVSVSIGVQSNWIDVWLGLRLELDISSFDPKWEVWPPVPFRVFPLDAVRPFSKPDARFPRPQEVFQAKLEIQSPHEGEA